MKRKCMNKLMVGVLAVEMTLSGCVKSSEPPVETTSEGYESTANAAETTEGSKSSANATEATIATLPEMTEVAQTTEPGTVQVTDPTTAPTTAPEDDRFDAFKAIAKQDAFADAKVSGDRLIKCDTIKDEDLGTERSRIRMMDKLGKELLSFTLSSDDPFTFEYSTVTEDDGLLFVLCRSGSEGDAERRIIRLGSDGRVQFTTQLDGIAFDSIDHCFEVDGKYYLFGTCKRVNTGILDVCAIQIEADGRPRKTAKIGGEDDTKLILAEPSEEGFLVLVETRSSTGDFEEINLRGNLIDVAISMDKEFNTLEMTEKELQEATRKPIGEKAGKPVYSTDPLVQASGLEDPSLFIDYGDHYLIRGQREIGRFYSKGSNYEEALEKVYETVYTVYDMDGNVVFREAIDRSLEVGDPFARCLPATLLSRTHNLEAWYCDQFMSAGEPPFSMPAGAKQDENMVEGVYVCSNVSRADYEDFLAEIKSKGFKRYPANDVNYMFRDDCLIVTWFYFNSGSYRFYWYAGSVPEPEGGISGEEAADLLLTERDESSSLSALYPIDVSPEGFYERTGGQLFVAPRYGNDRWTNSSLFFVKDKEVWSSTLESVAVYDVDDDGKDEVLLLSYGPTSGLYTVTLECLTGEDNLDISPIGSGWTFNTDENGRLRLGNSYIGVKDILGEKQLLLYEEVIYESIDGEKTEYLQVIHGWGGPNFIKRMREENLGSVLIRSR